MANFVKDKQDLKDRTLITRKDDPFNAGPSLEQQRRSYLTPRSLFFVRNHGDVPEIEVDAFRLRVGGLVRRPLELSLDELNQFPSASVVATIECAGNRRREMMNYEMIDEQIHWDHEAISTATWRGVRLCDVLEFAEVDDSATDVAFLGLDQVQLDSEETQFGGSITMRKALASETLLALEMNGEPLSPLHGFPLRVVVPGFIGARSVKWLSEIVVQNAPSTNYFQAIAYRLFDPAVRLETARSAESVMLSELRLNSVITAPSDGDRLQEGPVPLEGYAVGDVVRVELSSDGGTTWNETRLSGSENRWAWKFWEGSVHLKSGSHQLTVRAWDSNGSTQPENVSQIWNYKGYMNNSWHRVTVHVE